MPRAIKELHRQIYEHPDYHDTLTEGTRFAFEMACMGGFSSCNKENNKWCRDLWKFLYLGEDATGQFATPKLP